MFQTEVETVAARISNLLSSRVREATSDEITKLEKNGNLVSGKIFCAPNFSDHINNIRNNVLMGTVVLNLDSGRVDLGQSGSNLPALPPSVIGCTLSDVIVDGNSFLKDSAMIHSCFIASGCVLIGNGIISGNTATEAYGVGSEIVLCEETGTRSILSHPDCCSLESVCAGIQSRAARVDFNNNVSSFQKSLSTYLSCSEVAKFMGTVLLERCVIMRATGIKSSWLRSGVSITSAEVHASIVSEKAVIENAMIENSIIGRNVSINGFAVVEHSILCEYSKISVHGKVVHSIVGSYSGVESGECVSSLIGPFVGFHHQSLCIATYWPGGRGNIGYGANVGSNHSGKAPDCELLAGEGLFFGLATVIKFPCNFINAPYSLIASGVTCLPQRMEMPFSLINTGSLAAQLPGYNEISPAWVLSDNMFTLIRNEDKFGKRQKKDASVTYDYEIFRPDIMRLVIKARAMLLNVKTAKSGPDAIYTEADIEGLGKNYLREHTRQRAIDTYSFVLRWYGLRGLYRRIMAVGEDAVAREIDAIRAPSVSDGVISGTNLTKTVMNRPEEDWKHCIEVLEMERMNLKETKSLLEEFSKLDFLISANCVSSKAKDDVRGSKIVGNLYSEFHQPAHEHAVCIKAKKLSAEIEANVAKIVSRL